MYMATSALRSTERVVRRLEIVDVQEEDGKSAAVANLTTEPVLHPVLEERAVREAGDHVVKRLVRELLLEGLALGHIAGV